MTDTAHNFTPTCESGFATSYAQYMKINNKVVTISMGVTYSGASGIASGYICTLPSSLVPTDRSISLTMMSRGTDGSTYYICCGQLFNNGRILFRSTNACKTFWLTATYWI